MIQNKLADGWQLVGMAIGVYTGGTPNIAAIKAALHIDSTTFLMFHTYDTLLSAIYILFFITIAQKLFNLFLPKFKSSNNSPVRENGDGADHAEEIDSYHGMFAKKIIVGLATAVLLAVLVVAAALGIGALFHESYSISVTIIAITTFGIAIAAAWAAMQALGEDGYLNHAKTTMETTKRLLQGIKAIPELEIVGKQAMSLFAYRSVSKKLSIYAVGDQMEKRCWHIDRQQRPECLHAMVTPIHAEIVDNYLADLRASVAHVKKNPELAIEGSAATYGMISQFPLRKLVRKNVLNIMTDLYGPEGKMINISKPELDLEGGSEDLSMKAGKLFLKLKNKFR